jgi:amyloid beta precursor protein binding protein 1
MASLLSDDPDFLLSFTMIIASNLAPSIESQIGDILWGGRLQSCLARSKIQADVAASSTAGGPDIPLVLVRSSGFIGRIEIQVREHCGMSVWRQRLYADIDSR